MNSIIEDNYRHKGLRKQMVDQLRTKGITDEAVLAAINEVPRHVFLDSSFVELAYQDQAFPIGSGQTISQRRQPIQPLSQAAKVSLALSDDIQV